MCNKKAEFLSRSILDACKNNGSKELTSLFSPYNLQTITYTELLHKDAVEDKENDKPLEK